MKILTFSFLLFLMSAFFTTAHAQVENETQSALQKFRDENKVILKYYTIEQLQEINNTDTVKFNTIFYYYKSSFILTPIDCTDCITFDHKDFDVSMVESYRLKTSRYEHDFEKYGVHLTLLSIDELEYKMPIHQ